MSFPPGPTGSLAMRTLRWVRRPTEMMREFRRRCGDVFTLRVLGSEPTVFVADPESVRRVFALGPDEVGVPVVEPFTEMLGPTSIIVAQGREHQRQRRPVVAALHRDHVTKMSGVMCRRIEAAIDRWPLDRAFSMQTRAQGIVRRCMMDVVLGDGAAELDELDRMFDDVTALVSGPLILVPIERQWLLGGLSPWTRALRIRARGGALLEREIRRRRSMDLSGRHDVLSLLVAARDEHGGPLSDSDIQSQIVSVITAGYDTTGIALAWAVHELLDNPDALGRVRVAVREATADTDGSDLADRLAGCALLDAAVREALRLHPVFPYMLRVLHRPLRIGNFDLPAGTRVAPCAHLVHRDPALYRDPDRFVPERFLAARPEPWEYFPFGGGVRRCAGVELATLSMKLALGIILLRTELRRAPGRPPHPKWRFFSLAPSDGVRVVVERRLALSAVTTRSV